MAALTKFTLPGSLLLLTLGHGLWVSLSGKPYPGLLFNAHKLAALATVILIVVRMVLVLKGIQLQPLVVFLLALAVLCGIALFVTGALLSIGTFSYLVILTIHQVALVLLPLSTACALYLLSQGGPV